MTKNRDESKRDKRGRWRKGHCPNPIGRPIKKPQTIDSHLGNFKNHKKKVTINGEEQYLTRHAILLHAMFEQAVKGKSYIVAKMLLEAFIQESSAQAELAFALRDLLKQANAYRERHGEYD